MNFELNVTAMLMSYESDSYPIFLLFSCVCNLQEELCLRVFKLSHLSETSGIVCKFSFLSLLGKISVF